MIRVGGMGSSVGPFDEPIVEASRRLGAAITQRGCCLLTGACPGLPLEVVKGAKAYGGHTIGISPAATAYEHAIVLKSPTEFDIIIYTGLGFMGSEIINIRSSDIVVIIGGSPGTLGEFAIAYEEGKLIGVLGGSGGITTVIPEIARTLRKRAGAEIVYNENPSTLMAQLLAQYQHRVAETNGHLQPLGDAYLGEDASASSSTLRM